MKEGREKSRRVVISPGEKERRFEWWIFNGGERKRRKSLEGKWGEGKKEEGKRKERREGRKLGTKSVFSSREEK